MKLFASMTLPLIVGCLAGCSAQAERESKPRFKGVELYSWKDQTGAWKFALLDGTNEEKSDADILRDHTQLGSLNELKKSVAKLAAGEHLTWNDRPGFPLPPAADRQEVLAAAKQANVQLNVN